MTQTSSTSNPRPKLLPAGRRLRIVLGVALAVALLGWLFDQTSVEQAEVWSALGRDPFAIFAIMAISFMATTYFSMRKWRMLLDLSRPTGSDTVDSMTMYAYTLLGAAASQIVPPYIAGPAIRGLAMKTRHDGGFARNAAIAGYEQIFDVAVIAIAGSVALAILLADRIDAAGVLMVFVALFAICGAFLVLPPWVRPAKAVTLLPENWLGAKRLRKAYAAASSVGLDHPKLIGKMMILSTIRYGVLIARTILIGFILLPDVAWQLLALGFGAVQLSTLVTITPGNLGVTETGWGALGQFAPDVTSGGLIAFALVLRFSGLLVGLVLSAIALLWLRRA